MAETDNEDKTEEPTAKRLREAAQRGQVLRSRELNTTLMLLIGGVAFLFLGGYMFRRLEAVIADSFQIERAKLFDPGAMIAALVDAIWGAFWAIAPLLAILTVAALIGPLVLGGWNFATQAMQPKANKINPLNGLKRMFGPQGAMELAKALAKFFVIGSTAILILWQVKSKLLALGANEPAPALAELGELLLWSFLLLSAVSIVIAAVDVPFQIWNHNKQLRMTKQEVKDENKETEGNPEVKRKIRGLQMQQAQARMMEAVPQADVVVTNPTHFAVALKYDQTGPGAPKVVASGVDLVAMHIREVARANEVPQVEAPTLARALYYTTELDQEIPTALFIAVAQVLAYVYQLKAARHEGRQPPAPPRDLPVPDTYRYPA